MARSFYWIRKKISPDEYARMLGKQKDEGKEKEFIVSISSSNKKIKRLKISVNSSFLEAITDSSKQSTAYKVASDIRKFEIDKYWQRTLYFWGFISAIYIAYFNVLKDLYSKDGVQSHGTIPLFILSVLGLIFCFSWLLVCKGSKHWQENWEQHIDLLEDEITGPLFKIYSANTPNSFSVSKINIAIGVIITFCAFILVIFETFSFTNRTLKLIGICRFTISILIIFLVMFILMGIRFYVKGNKENCGSFDFDIKEYKTI